MCNICQSDPCTCITTGSNNPCTAPSAGSNDPAPFSLQARTGNWLDWFVSILQTAGVVIPSPVPLNIRATAVSLAGNILTVTMEAVGQTLPVEWSTNRRTWSNNPVLTLINSTTPIFIYGRVISQPTSEASIRANNLVACPVSVAARRGMQLKTTSGTCYTVAASSTWAVGDCFSESVAGLVADTACALFNAAGQPVQSSLTLSVVVGGQSSLTITFGGVGNATSLLLERSINGTSGWTMVAIGNATASYIDNGLTADTTYYYRLSALLPLPVRVSAVASAKTAVAVATSLPAIAGFVATSPSPSTSHLEWNNVTGAERYEIDRSPNGIDGWDSRSNNLAAGNGAIVILDETLLTAATTYYYRVRAKAVVGGNTIYSAYVYASATTASPAVVLPPASLIAVALSATSVRVSYSPVTGATSYDIDRSLNGNDNWVSVATAYGDITINDPLATTANTTYYYRVRTHKGVLTSSYSTNASVTTLTNTTYTIAITGQGNSQILDGQSVVLTASHNAPAGYTLAWYQRDINANTESGRGTNSTYTVNGFAAIGGFRFGCRLKDASGGVVATAGEVAFTLVANPFDPLPNGAVVVAYKPDWLLSMGQNGTVNMDVMNLLFDATTNEAIKVRLTRNGLVIPGTIMADQSGRFMVTDKVSFYGAYEQCIRLDRLIAGVGGLATGDVINVVAYRETAPADVMSVTWTVTQPLDTTPIVITIPDNPNGTTSATARLITLSTYSIITSVVVPDSANPSNLVVTSRTANTITLGWASNNAGINSFEIQKKLSSASVWTALGVRAVNSPGWVDSGLTASTSYDYQVRSLIAGGGYSAYTTLANQTTNADAGGADPFVDTNMTTVRYAGLGPFMNGRDPVTGGIQPLDVEFIEASLLWYGRANCFFPTLSRKMGVNADGSYDYRQLDSVLALANRLNILVIPQFNMAVGTNGGDTPDLIIPVSERQVDHLGNVLNSGGSTVASFDSTVDRISQGNYLSAMLNRIAASPYVGKVSAISVCGGQQLETEYNGGNSNGTQVTFDFSEPAMAKFRQRAAGWYPATSTLTSIQVANAAWGKNFASFAAITRSDIGASATGDNYNSNQLLRDFFKHRTLSLAEYSNWWHDLVKAKSSRIKTIYRCGNLRDGLSFNRGTIALVPLLRADIILQDNIPSYPLRYAHTLALRDQRQSYGAAENPFFNDDAFYNEDTQVQWQVDTYSAYGSLSLWEGFIPLGADNGDANAPAKIAAGKARIKRIMDRVHAQYPIGGTITRPAVQATLQESAATLLTYGHNNTQAGVPSYETQFNTLRQNNTQQVAINVTALP